MADLSGVQQAVQKIAEQTVQDQGKSGANKATARAEDVQKLQDALNQSQRQPEAPGVNDPQQAGGAEKVGRVEQTTNESPGAKILNGMHGIQKASAELKSLVAQPNLGQEQLLQIQAKMIELNTQQDLLGKVVSTTEKDLNELKNGQ